MADTARTATGVRLKRAGNSRILIEDVRRQSNDAFDQCPVRSDRRLVRRRELGQPAI
jgi:hypothetical protein